jgi:hypothetical protein
MGKPGINFLSFLKKKIGGMSVILGSDTAARAGKGVRSLGLRQIRYFGLAKTSLQHFGTAAALNLIRLDAFLAEKKTAKTRTSRFAALAPH